MTQRVRRRLLDKGFDVLSDSGNRTMICMTAHECPIMPKTKNNNRRQNIPSPLAEDGRALGHLRWAIAEGYVPKESTGPAPEMLSHETACILNANDREAHVRITIYFSDRDPVGPYLLTVGPRRTKHVRFNDLNDPAPVPRGKDYSSVIESDVPIVVQHTRLDSRQAANALLSTIAFGDD